MEGYTVVTVEDEKVGKVVEESGDYVIVEHGTLRKSKHALPREFAHVDESEEQVRLTISKNVFLDSPTVDETIDEQAVADYYGIAPSSSPVTDEPGGINAIDRPPESADGQARYDGVVPAEEERAHIREDQ